MKDKLTVADGKMTGNLPPQQRRSLPFEKQLYSGGKDGSYFIKETIVFWTRRSERLLSREEAREAVANVSSFFQVLAEWKRMEHEVEEQKGRKEAVGTSISENWSGS